MSAIVSVLLQLSDLWQPEQLPLQPAQLPEQPPLLCPRISSLKQTATSNTTNDTTIAFPRNTAIKNHPFKLLYIAAASTDVRLLFPSFGTYPLRTSR